MVKGNLCSLLIDSCCIIKIKNNVAGTSSCSNKKHQGINQGPKALFVFILFGLLCLNKLSAQPPSQDPNWIYDTVVNGVQFYHSIVDCDGKKVVFLKFNSTNNNKVEVSWNEVFTTQVKANQDGFQGLKKLTLLRGETSASNCTESQNRTCLILPGDVSPAYKAEIQKFEFKNISVNPI